MEISVRTRRKRQSYPLYSQVTPYQVREELCRFCQENGVVIEAFSPLTMGLKLKEPRLNKIAQKYGKQPAQILIRWYVSGYFAS
jgi:diketogulonate reductase-like aldo/keto reductase